MAHTVRLRDGNRLLASLPTPDWDYLASAMRVERPPRGRILSSRSKRPTDIWFPHSGVVALGTTDADGHGTQPAFIGSEGCVGVETLLDQAPNLADATVQIEGDISVIAAARFRSALKARPPIREAVQKYLYALSAQLLQTTACDRLHTLERRCCRALLLMQDSTGMDELALTQESLAALLGCGRPRINGVLGSLERKGLLRREHGRITLLRRTGLEERSCDCYQIVRRVFDSLGISTRRPRIVT
jgi:CRP-like cAMP-binding protein